MVSSTIFRVGLFLGFKNMFASKRTMLLIVMIIGMSFLAANFGNLLIKGIQETIQKNAVSFLTSDIMLLPGTDKTAIEDYKQMTARLDNIRAIKAYSPRVYSSVTLENGDGSKIKTSIIVSDHEKDALVYAVKSSVFDGSYISDASDIVVGTEVVTKYAKVSNAKLDTKVGDSDRIVFANGVEKSVKLAGVFTSYALEYDRQVHVDLSLYESAVGKVSSVSIIGLKLREGEDIKAVARALQKVFPDLQVVAWNDEKLGISDITKSFDTISNLISLIGLVTAFFVIYIIVYINILNKKTQIGIMKAVGISDYSIIISYVILSVMISVLGCLFGVTLMFLTSQYFHFNPLTLPMGKAVPELDFSSMLRNALILFTSSLIAGAYPSSKISRDNILELIFKG